MGFMAVKETIARQHVEGTKRWLTCPQCGEHNEIGTSRCRDCMSSLVQQPASRPATRSAIRSSTTNLDALWGELEALTRPDEIAWLQCPECGRMVDGAATRCTCGAVFEDPEEAIGYACPLCGARVTSDAVRCRCGAWFSD